VKKAYPNRFFRYPGRRQCRLSVSLQLPRSTSQSGAPLRTQILALPTRRSSRDFLGTKQPPSGPAPLQRRVLHSWGTFRLTSAIRQENFPSVPLRPRVRPPQAPRPSPSGPVPLRPSTTTRSSRKQPSSKPASTNHNRPDGDLPAWIRTRVSMILNQSTINPGQKEMTLTKLCLSLEMWDGRNNPQ
jgi:hypothetical protein